jgi:acetyltransferase-like isoleucine patch superfamily enzyme
VRSDHRPLGLKRAQAAWHGWWARHFLCPQFDAIGEGLVVYNPRHVEISGPRVRIGRDAHILATRDRPIRFTVYPGTAGAIEIGDYPIILAGARFASATSITAGKSCMFATHSYLSDADWHDHYDRTSAPGPTRAIRLGDNVWVGDSAIVCKGVSIGDNSIIGAGAVVTRDVPANAVAVGNPARVVKELDPARELVTRERLFTGEESWEEYIDRFERWVLTPNTFRAWLRSVLAPTRED